MTTPNKNVPTLRFPEFEDDWQEKKLSEVCRKIMDGTHFSPKSTEGKRKYLTSKNIRNNGLDLSNCNYISEEEHQSIYKRCPVKFGDVLLTKDGANTGNCCINTLEEEFSLLSSVAVLDGKKDLLNNKFLLQTLQSYRGINTINNVMAGQAISRITLEKINNFKFFIPSLSEQQKLAAFLTAVNERSQQLAKKKALLEQYKKGVKQKIFNQEIRFKDNNGDDFADWEEKPLSEVCRIYDGTHMTPNYKESGIPFYSVEHVTADNFTQTKFIANEVYEQENKRVKLEKGDILMTRIGDIGTAKYISWDVKASFYVSLALIKQSNLINSLYLNQYISTDDFQRELWKRTIHVAFPKKINLGEIGNCLIKIPEKSEQEKIALLLSAIDDKINLVRQQLEKIKEYKKGLLQQMFI